jgi:alkanesulfonate monooxygenase SsuD/methylene tetrahydromethanopterin reductase-like flavin-dependent oxidoreductase (luciferase family)
VRYGLSVRVFTGDPSVPFAAARAAAEAGFDAVFAPDHVFPPGSPGRSSIEATTLLAACAAANPRLGVGVLVTRIGMRPAGVLAKVAAGLDHVSGGRAIIGIGLGDASGRAEHEAVGLAFPPIERRTIELEETATALRMVFGGHPYPGGTEIGAIAGPILPVARPRVWVGGLSDRVLEVAGRAADAWNGWGIDAEGFAERASSLATAVRDSGRDPGEVEPTWGGIALVGEDAAELARLERERADAGLSMDIWRGTVDDLRRFRDDLGRAGCTWMALTAAGPVDRVEVIGRALRA